MNIESVNLCFAVSKRGEKKFGSECSFDMWCRIRLDCVNLCYEVSKSAEKKFGS
jgi:hypothetical protein